MLLAKPRSRMETVNDIDQDLITFWRVLRDRPVELARLMQLTPHGRAEHAAAYALDVPDLERARRVWVLLSQGRGGTLRRTGWRHYRNPTGTSHGMPPYLSGYANRVPACAARLHGVSLECRDALQVIRDYGQDTATLLYCDPAYLGSTRAANYRHEMTGPREHEELAAVLHAAKAGVVLSGYPSPLYDARYRGWYRRELTAWTGNGLRDGRNTDGDRVEVVWANRPFPDGEHLFSQHPD